MGDDVFGLPIKYICLSGDHIYLQANLPWW